MPPRFRWEPSKREDPTKSSFITLPRELRDLIYNLFLPRGRELMRTNIGSRWGNGVKHVWTYLIELSPNIVPVNLLASCRQLHYETAEILYGENIFEDEGYASYPMQNTSQHARMGRKPWSVVPTRYCHLVRRVHLNWHISQENPPEELDFLFGLPGCLNVIKDWPNVKELRVNIVYGELVLRQMKQTNQSDNSREKATREIVEAVRARMALKSVKFPQDLKIEFQMRSRKAFWAWWRSEMGNVIALRSLERSVLDGLYISWLENHIHDLDLEFLQEVIRRAKKWRGPKLAPEWDGSRGATRAIEDKSYKKRSKRRE